jgi:MFS family permease
MTDTAADIAVLAGAPATLAAAPELRRRALMRAFAASLTGTALEYYDFAIFGSAAALVFGPLFFAKDQPLTGLFASFATYAFGYVARPLGGIVFGRLGDIIGRRKVLVTTLLLVGVSTFLMGLLPTYARVGALAPALLVVLRFAQGVGVGGEWGGAVLITAELSAEGERGFWASAAQIGPPAGTLLANGVLALLTRLPEASFQSWGWRVAFLSSALLVGFGLWIRTRVEETAAFRETASHGRRSHAPVTEVLRLQRRALAAAILARIGPDVLYSMFAVFVLAYAPRALGTPDAKAMAVTAVAGASALQLFLVPAAGWLSDRWGRRRIYAVGCVGAMLWSMGFFVFVHDFPSLVIGVVGALACHSLMYGPQAAFIIEQFPAHLRSTGSSLGYTCA